MTYLEQLDKSIQANEARLQTLSNDYQATFGAIQALKFAKATYVNLQTSPTPQPGPSVVAVFPDGIKISSPEIGGDTR